MLSKSNKTLTESKRGVEQQQHTVFIFIFIFVCYSKFHIELSPKKDFCGLFVCIFNKHESFRFILHLFFSQSLSLSPPPIFVSINRVVMNFYYYFFCDFPHFVLFNCLYCLLAIVLLFVDSMLISTVKLNILCSPLSLSLPSSHILSSVSSPSPSPLIQIETTKQIDSNRTICIKPFVRLCIVTCS